MAEAARKKNSGAAVATLLNPSLTKTKVTRNHIQDNARAVKELEAAALARRQLDELGATQAASWTMPRFRDVPSKLAQAGLGHTVRSPPKKAADAPRSATPEPMEREPVSAAAAVAAAAAASGSSRPGTGATGGAGGSSKPAVPRRNELAQLAPREAKDHLAANARAAVTATARRTEEPTEAPRHAAGEVPAYLRERQAQWASEQEERRRAEEEQRQCPPGHSLMPEAERLETLALLEKSLAETRDALSKIKITSDLPSIVRRRAELEEKLRKLEAGITVFGRPRVFVKAE